MATVTQQLTQLVIAPLC